MWLRSDHMITCAKPAFPLPPPQKKKFFFSLFTPYTYDTFLAIRTRTTNALSTTCLVAALRFLESGEKLFHEMRSERNQIAQKRV